jgi:hypothetical protein
MPPTPRDGVIQDNVTSELAVLAQQGYQLSKSLSVDCSGAELEFELGQSATILALSSASRALSLLFCKISLSLSTTGCQLSYSFGEDCVYDNQRRQRGNVDKSSDC